MQPSQQQQPNQPQPPAQWHPPQPPRGGESTTGLTVLVVFLLLLTIANTYMLWTLIQALHNVSTLGGLLG
jgi:hypothetical protein